ncbi:hypothetical protein MRX96_057275 [Rhipicephalus microplus]
MYYAKRRQCATGVLVAVSLAFNNSRLRGVFVGTSEKKKKKAKEEVSDMDQFALPSDRKGKPNFISSRREGINRVDLLTRWAAVSSPVIVIENE